MAFAAAAPPAAATSALPCNNGTTPAAAPSPSVPENRTLARNVSPARTAFFAKISSTRAPPAELRISHPPTSFPATSATSPALLILNANRVASPCRIATATFAVVATECCASSAAASVSPTSTVCSIAAVANAAAAVAAAGIVAWTRMV
ncbi:MAG: hypothetical protein LBT53_06985, partial [Puniceicoccales bacterium]|nr:hypothetical protein [Puniceicoccales bacterium]